MSIDHSRVLVTGATGRYGAIAESLLARGHAVRAMTRDPRSPAAQRVRAAGAELVAGDFDDAATIERAARGVDVVFATGTAHRAGLDGELRHGLNLAAGVAAAGDAHLVFVSGEGAAPDSPLALFRIKHRVEEQIRSLEIPHTILAPVYLMENLFNPWNRPSFALGQFPSPVSPDRRLQQVAVRDVTSFAVMAIENPAQFANERIPLASDQLDAREAADAFSRTVGRRFEPAQLPYDDLPYGLRALFIWLEENGTSVDIDALRARYPSATWSSYEPWLATQRERLRESCPHEHAYAQV